MRQHIRAERGCGAGATHPVMVVTCTVAAARTIIEVIYFPFGQNLKTSSAYAVSRSGRSQRDCHAHGKIALERLNYDG